jgi:hypothetical protein
MKKTAAKKRTHVTQAEFARLIGVTRQRVSALIQSGLPTTRDGSIDREAGLHWVEQNVLPRNGNEPGSNRTLLDVRVQRELIKLKLDGIELQRQEGTFIHIDDACEAWGGMITTARARLLAIPSKLAQTLALETTVQRCHALLDDEIRSALTELANPK